MIPKNRDGGLWRCSLAEGKPGEAIGRLAAAGYAPAVEEMKTR